MVDQTLQLCTFTVDRYTFGVEVQKVQEVLRFRPDAAGKALEIAHRQVFYQLSAYSLEELVAQLQTYLDCSHESAAEVLRTWQKLEPYRVAIPLEVNPAVARLFLSNIRLALAIWRFRQEQVPKHP